MERNDSREYSYQGFWFEVEHDWATGNSSSAYEAKLQIETVGKSGNRKWHNTVLSTVLIRFV